MSDFMYILINILNEGVYDCKKIKLDFKINDKSLLKTLYKILHISIQDYFSNHYYNNDLMYNTLKAIQELSSYIKLSNEEILRTEKRKLEEINYIKSLKLKNNEKNKEFNKVISKLESITIYPNNTNKPNNEDFKYLIDNYTDIYIIKNYLFDNKSRINDIKNDDEIIKLLCDNFVRNYNLRNENMYYYLYILKLLKPNKLNNTKIKNIYKNIDKDTTYHEALKTFNILLNGKEINPTQEKILDLYNIKFGYKDMLKTINIRENIKENDTLSITIDPKKTSNVKDDALSITKTKNEYILGIPMISFNWYKKYASFLRHPYISVFF